MVDWSWIISQITFWRPPFEDGRGQDHESHLASTEMQRVPSLLEEKYLGAAIWVRRPTERALNNLVTISSSFSLMHRVVGYDGFGSGRFTEGGLGWVSRLGSGSQDGGAVSGESCRLVQVLKGCVLHTR